VQSATEPEKGHSILAITGVPTTTVRPRRQNILIYELGILEAIATTFFAAILN
jgi:hypothetical protein